MVHEAKGGKNMNERPKECDYTIEYRTCCDCPYFFHDENGYGCTYEEDDDGEV